MTGATFTIHRYSDPTGISGTGVVAEGVEWSDGTVALRWLTATPSLCIYSDIRHIQAIHGHRGSSEIVWDDPTKYTPAGNSVEPPADDNSPYDPRD